MKLQHIIAGLLVVPLLQACNAGPDSTRPALSNGTVRTPHAQITEHTSQKDQKYVALLQDLSERTPNTEGKQARARGEHYLLGYYSGRAGLKLPGLSAEQHTTQRCEVKTIDGLGDVIYGENHLKYRIAIRKFAKEFNSQMLGVCV